MKKATILSLALVCLAVGVLSAACGAELNPNTEKNIYSALDAQKGQYKACYEEALKADRNLKGEMALTVAVEAESTKIDSATVTQSAIADKSMQTCVETATTGVSITEQPNVAVEGTYAVDFLFE